MVVGIFYVSEELSDHQMPSDNSTSVWHAHLIQESDDEASDDI